MRLPVILSVSLLSSMMFVTVAADAAPGTRRASTGTSKTKAVGPVDSDQTTATGPKVHTSKSKDITDCGKTSGGPRSVAGLGLGTLIGSRIKGNSTGIIAGAAVAGTVGENLDRNARCGPKATVESNGANEKPKKKKLNLRDALGF